MTPEALRNGLTQAWAHGEHLDAVGAHLCAPVELDGLTLRSFDLSGARFDHGLRAQGSLMRGLAWLKQAKITGVCDLRHATCRSDLRLDGLVCDQLILAGGRFEGVVDLDGARIGRVDLSGALCLANLSLAGAQIDQLDLRACDAMGGIWAEGAQLGDVASEDLLIEGRAQAFLDHLPATAP